MKWQESDDFVAYDRCIKVKRMVEMFKETKTEFPFIIYGLLGRQFLPNLLAFRDILDALDFHMLGGRSGWQD